MVYTLLFSALAAAVGTVSVYHSAILYQNDGNWTAHATNPSAVLFFDSASYSDAERMCTEINETLITENELSTSVRYFFWQALNYQVYLGKISSVSQFWTLDGSWSDSTTSMPFICTNSAPIVDQPDPGYYRFLTVNVTSNGTIYTGVRDHMAYRFLKVPYTLPPVGDLRLALPVPWYANETETVRNCTVSRSGREIYTGLILGETARTASLSTSSLPTFRAPKPAR